MTKLKDEIISYALSIGAIKVSPTCPFTWASGYKMPIYNDHRKLLSSPDIRQLITEQFYRMVWRTYPSTDLIAGTATAGIPHATLLAQFLDLPMVYVRSGAKDHGLGNVIEGLIPSYVGKKAVLIEDVISTGGSSLRARDHLESAGIIVQDILSIFHYEFPLSPRSPSIYTMTDLVAYLDREEVLTPDALRELDRWRSDPFNWHKSKESS